MHSQEADRVPLGLSPSPGARQLINFCVLTFPLPAPCLSSFPFLLSEVLQTKANAPILFQVSGG